jgi:hypothetical protein
MAYKFFGGRGAVICDHCKIIIDADISYKDYEECYNKDAGDVCWKCMHGIKNKPIKKLHPSLNRKFH